jgi:hypothetical protein
MKITKRQLKRLVEGFLNEVELPDAPGYAAKGKYAYPQFQSKDDIKRFILRRMQDYANISGADFSGQFGTQYDDYSTEEGKTIRDYRKYSKAIWNRFADHAFFKSRIAKLHQIGYADSGALADASIDKRYLSSSAELSVWGIKSANPLQPAPKELYGVANSYGDSMDRSILYLVLDGRITWAGDFDAYTEELSSHRSNPGTDEDEKRKLAIKSTQASGIPKRPGGVSLFNSPEDLRTFPILLDEEDVDNIPHPLIDEMIIDNWKVTGVTLFLDMGVISLNNNSIDELAEKINKLGERRPTPFHRLKNASKEGFPNPMICDYKAGRYYTEAEMKELFEKIN